MRSWKTTGSSFACNRRLSTANRTEALTYVLCGERFGTYRASTHFLSLLVHDRMCIAGHAFFEQTHVLATPAQATLSRTMRLLQCRFAMI